ncbi:hypothetical protein HY418_02575 [Candidatus Kaiserbacteria bacterium]|nr:hypothetical protein [Candidatus Kaiserbacteria bacterium]
MGKHIRKISKYKPSALQGRIDFTPVARMSFAAEHSFERTALRVIFVSLAALACLYLYFVTASVLHVMARREALAEVNNIQASIGTLEQHYFQLSQGISAQDGPPLGLAPVADTSYVYRPGTIGAATIARNEI